MKRFKDILHKLFLAPIPDHDNDPKNFNAVEQKINIMFVFSLSVNLVLFSLEYLLVLLFLVIIEV